MKKSNRPIEQEVEDTAEDTPAQQAAPVDRRETAGVACYSTKQLNTENRQYPLRENRKPPDRFQSVVMGTSHEL